MEKSDVLICANCGNNSDENMVIECGNCKKPICFEDCFYKREHKKYGYHFICPLCKEVGWVDVESAQEHYGESMHEPDFYKKGYKGVTANDVAKLDSYEE